MRVYPRKLPKISSAQTQFSEKDLKSRMSMLKSYVDALVKQPEIRDLPVVQAFLSARAGASLCLCIDVLILYPAFGCIIIL